jgi:FAD synthase
VPTLNLAPNTEVLPATGVYVTRTQDLEDGRVWPSITNVGYRPTFGDGRDLSIETFLLEPLAEKRRAASAWNSCGACGTSASSRTRRR